jgi:hypothetical protein
MATLTTPGMDSQPFAAPIEPAMLKRLVKAISSVGSHRLGFRAAGTPEEHAVAELVAAEMDAIGLGRVGFEEVPVDAWRFRDAAVTLGAARFPGSSLASVPSTPRRGVKGHLVLVGGARRDRLDRLDLNGCVALVEWQRAGPWISETALELGRRGAAAIVLASFQGAPRFTSEGALGTSVGRWHAGAPPVVTVRQAAARRLIAAARNGRPAVTVTLDATIDRRAKGRNVCGVLAPELPGAPVVVGAHHDGWFFGAFDNASGVATMLTVAKALIRAGWRPSRPVWFVSHTAEEYGLLDDDQPWCVGAWHQVAVEHSRWGSTVPFYLDIEASGRPEFPLCMVGPVELRRFATGWCRRAERTGMLSKGWTFERPTTGTHQWPFQLAGVPGLSVLNWHEGFARTEYHTDKDTFARMDFAHLADLARLYAALLVDAERRGDGLLDARARARDVARSAPALGESAARYGRNGSRRAFTRLARAGIAVDAQGETGYLHEQAARDARQLGIAIAAIDAGDLRAAARAAAKVGMNRMHRWVSRDVQATAERRYIGSSRSWPAKSHLTRTPNLWREIAALRGEPGARAHGAWVRRSLEQQQARMDAEAKRRIARLAAALNVP